MFNRLWPQALLVAAGLVIVLAYEGWNVLWRMIG